MTKQMQKTLKYLLDIQDRLDEDIDLVTDEENSLLLAFYLHIPIETIEARLALLQNKKLLSLDGDLPMTGNVEDENFEDEYLDFGGDDDGE